VPEPMVREAKNCQENDENILLEEKKQKGNTKKIIIPRPYDAAW
jgi:hypothetical protein